MAEKRQKRTWYVEHLKKKRRSKIKQWALAIGGLLAVAAVVVVAAIAIQPKSSTTSPESVAAAEAARESREADRKAKEASDLAMVRIEIIGDSYTDGSSEGGKGNNGWPRLVEEKLRAENLDFKIRTTGLGGSGYLSEGTKKRTFLSPATRISGDTDVVVIFGGLNDAIYAGSSVRKASARVYAAVAERAPKATLIVVGGQYPTPRPTAEYQNVRSAIKESAKSNGSTFIDPISWFDDKFLIGKDGIHPTDAGHKLIAENLFPVIMDAVKDHS